MEPAPVVGPEARRARLEPAARRLQIVEAAIEVFRGRDPATVRFDEVARAAGVSRSLVYAYFGDRGELVAAVHLHTMRDLDAELSQLLADVPVDESRLHRVVRTYFGIVERNAESWALFSAGGALDHPALLEARRARCQRIADTWGGGPAELLLARGIVGMLEAAASEWLVQRACSLDDAANLLSRALWRGVGYLPRRGSA
ncbi:MAG TPA: TetR/AcrR family transcriptional regulator [Acidimicrobiales bacterium]|jgi:AcrR family transcriptional regulator|nr:TetR/AcrR family transcriptional regulator [Acidimicrobiales bacterium]